MKVITAIAAAALIFGVTAASAQTPSSSASQPGATVNTDKEVPATGGNKAVDQKMKSGTTGAASGTTGGTNPNPTSNKNPDTEVPGKKLQ